MPVTVVLENRGDRPLSGTVTLGLIDGWKTQPEKPVSFEVAGKATTRIEFTVTAAANAVDALYPIHAYARFADAGRTLTAHPILIVPYVGAPSRVKAEPAASPTSWRLMLASGSGISRHISRSSRSSIGPQVAGPRPGER